MPGVPGLFLESQIPGWKAIASAIHAKGGIAYMQLWHSGRANIPHMTGTPTYSASATPWDDADERFMFPPPHSTQSVRYADFPPEEMSVEHIKKTIADYVRTARAKGLPRRTIIVRHTLRNSLIPVITFIGADIGALLGGAIVTESVFNLPGIGREVYDAIRQQEGAVVVGIVTLLVFFFIFFNLVVDVLYAVLDPRIRYD